MQVEHRLQAVHMPIPETLAENTPKYGAPVEVTPRLGQGTFRMIITDLYERRCAVTRERSLPTLDAAHIKPFGKDGTHDIGNGLLLRADIHRLFDSGYVTITPDFHFEVSPRLKADFDNGREYYSIHGREIWVPRESSLKPNQDSLRWHNTSVFKV